jgi:RES domain-containing protein
MGAHKFGGRWNTRRSCFVVYSAIDPATAILEVIVHQGVGVLDAVPHIMTSLVVDKTAVAKIHVVRPAHLPNQNWLRSGSPSASQQAFGDDLLARHEFVLLPSVVSPHSWTLLFDRSRATGLYKPDFQEDFALDTRLNPPQP